MPVLESTDKITPKSILRHRPIGESTVPPIGKRSTIAAQPVAQRASRPRPAAIEVETDEKVMEWKRKTTDTALPTQPKRASTTVGTLPHLPPLSRLTKKRALGQTHPLVYLGLGMIAMLILWTILSTVFGWFATFSDDIRYGRPRTFQMDAWVGHNEQTGVPTHFIALNLNRHIEIIEIPGGDAAHTRIFSGPQLYGANDDLAPVTLSFVDVNGDHRPDMLVTFQGSRLVFINDGTSFRPLLPSERQQVEQFLQHLGH
ncbi:MAG TPA: hypothetical protein VKR06_30265 [Ktedonosporobacter sp.]|nr:hypothetical protein [Ktedonosporobacter sp.]